MAIHYRCPKCQTEDQAGDDLAGTQIRCKQCGALLQLPGSRPSQHVTQSPGLAPPPPPLPPGAEPRSERRRDVDEDDYDDLPRRRGRDDDYGLARGEPPAGWSTVRAGLGMMFWSLIALVIEIVLIVIVAFATAGFVAGGAMRGQFRGPNENSMAAVVIVGVCSGLVTLLIYFIGKCLCCAAPTHSGARGYALGSTICAALIAVLFLLLVLIVSGMEARGNVMIFMPGQVEGPILAFSLLIVGLVYATVILFAIFMKATARYFGDEGLARGANGFLIFYIVIAALHAITGMLQFMLMPRGPFGAMQDVGPIFTVLGCIILVLLLAALVWFLVLLAQTRGTIGRALARPGY